MTSVTGMPADKREISPTGKFSLRGNAAFFAKLAISLGAFWLALHRVNTSAVITSFSRINWGYFAVALALSILMPILGGIRWWLVCKAIGCRARLGNLVRVFWAGMAMNQIMPAAMSDGLRVLLLVRRGYGAGEAASTIVLERAAMIFALLGMVVVTTPLIGATVTRGFPKWIPLAMLGAGTVGFSALLFADRNWGRRGTWRIIAVIAALSTHIRRILTSRQGGVLLISCLVSNLNFVAAGILLGIALGLAVPPLEWLVAIPLVVVVTVLPISIGGWGMREGLLVALLGAASVPVAQALTFSILFGALSAASSLPGLAFLWAGRATGAKNEP
ncbi:MAG: flippase-like domain-containing protein [Rhodospirillales bacterium]|nr:flippase-like domain-containing protein [Rhodospirillales bacterium]MDE2318516.1 flippase-like domain-containing protein [Rhodospirillales bacterium]